MKFIDVVEPLRKRGYVEREPNDHYRVFCEFDTLDFLYSDVEELKKYV